MVSVVMSQRLLLFTLSLGVAGFIGCSSNGELAQTGDQSFAAPAASSSPVGCRVVSSSATNAFCRQDWACEESGLLSLICATEDGGVSCLCSDGENPGKVIPADGLTCDSLILAKACGWDVSQ